MINRIRDRKPFQKPLATISFEEWDTVMDRFNRATAFMKDDNPIYTKMRNDYTDAREIILEGRTKELRETTVTENLMRMLITPKQVQLDAITGRYVYLKDFFAELDLWIQTKKDYESKEAEGILVIDRDNTEGKSDAK